MIAKNARSLVVCGLFFGGMLFGCGSNEPPSAMALGKFTGSWIQSEQTQTTGVIAIETDPNAPKLKIEIGDDKRFKMTWVDKEGNALSNKGLIEGAWQLKDGAVSFSVTTNSFSEEDKYYEPLNVQNVRTAANNPDLKADELRLMTGYQSVYFNRVE